MGMAQKRSTDLCPGGRERLSRIFRLMLTGKVDPTPMTTHELGFDEIERAFRLMQNKEDGVIKPLIRFGETAHRSRAGDSGGKPTCTHRAAQLDSHHRPRLCRAKRGAFH